MLLGNTAHGSYGEAWVQKKRSQTLTVKCNIQNSRRTELTYLPVIGPRHSSHVASDIHITVVANECAIILQRALTGDGGPSGLSAQSRSGAEATNRRRDGAGRF